jgi:NADH-quinone oxidoreductase subunit L
MVFSIAPVLLAVCGIGLATVMYKTENNKPAVISGRLGALYRWAYHKFYVDEVYLFVTRRIIFNLIGTPAAWIDKNIVDGGVNLGANLTEDTSGLIQNWQSGKLQQYAIWFFVGVIGMVAVFIYWWK